MNKLGKESVEDFVLTIIKIGLILFVGFLILNALKVSWFFNFENYLRN